jgi:hypothetical protein
LRITNVGYRLLRSTARVEPPNTRWVRITRPYDGVAFFTIEETELPIEVEIPEGLPGGLAAEIVIESNGGTRRIGVRIGAPERPPELPDSVAFSPGLTVSDRFGPAARALASIPTRARIAAGIVAALALRLLVLAAGYIPLGSHGVPITEPRLPALAALCAGVGLVVGLLRGLRRSRGPGDAATTGIAAGLFGVLAAAVLYAVVRTVEGSLGNWSSSFWALVLSWSAIGAAIAGVTGLVLPSRERSRGT